MLPVFAATLSPMLMMFACMVIGFILNKKKLCPENTASVLSKLENYVLVPALIINTFMKYCTVASLRDQYKLILYSVFATLLAIALAYPISKLFEKDAYKRNIYRYAIAFGNFGFMGNAIVPAIMGEEVLYYHLLFTLPLNLACYSWGVSILTPAEHRKKGVLSSLCNPVVIAIVVGALFGLLGVEKYIPAFVLTTITNLSACMGPIAMILTGFVVGGYDITLLLKNKKVYAATVLRLFLLPALFIGLFALCGADRQTLFLCLFAFATPLGLNTVVFPAAYECDTSIGASMAMISHTLCVITIPLMYALLTMLLS